MKPNTNLSQKEALLIYALLKLYAEGQLVAEGYHGEDLYGDGSYEPVSRKDARRLLKKLKPILDSEELKEAESAFLHAKYADWNRSPDEGVLKNIDKALADKRVIYIEYYSPDSGKVSRRDVSPYARNARYVVGYCHLRKNIRKFRLSRIVKIKLMGEKCEVPADFNRKEFL